MSAFTTDAPEIPKDRECHGLIYTWGFCTHGQLGLKESVLGAREYVETPTNAGPGSVLRDVELRSAACGHFHTLVVDVKGNVYAFGRNDRGQLGRGGDEDDKEIAAGTGSVPRLVLSLKRSIITDVACGAFHCLARTADGWMISWGWNKHGQLGRHTAYQSDSNPDLVREARDCPGAIRSFTAGFSHSAAVLHSGQILVWGSNEYGQLGVGLMIRHPEVASTPVPVPEIVGEQVAAGDNHLLVLSIDGQVFAAGDASYGRLGIGLEDPKMAKERAGRFAIVQNLPWADDYMKERIKMVAAGGATSAAISTHGRLFTWGGGVWGQLGIDTRADHDTAMLVSTLKAASHVSIAQDHMLAICHGDSDMKSAALWGWGRRQLLPSSLVSKGSDPEAECLPVQIPLSLFGSLQDLTVGGCIKDIRALCGGSHSVIVGSPFSATASERRFGKIRCPQFSSVTGPGTKGGVVSESLSFRIVSRNEEGRDDNVGGLRFCVWANPVAEAKTRRSIVKGDLNSWDTHPFELKHIIDARDGTYDGAYVIRKTGAYYLHVHMLRHDEEVEMHADFSKIEPGDPVKGSPFKIQIDSGRACARNCVVELRGVKRKRDGVRPDAVVTGGATRQNRVFTIEASSDATWDISAYDIFNNAVTHKLDRFSVWIDREEEDNSDAVSAGFEVDLADSMGLPKVASGRSVAGDALRERVRQRKAEKIWTRMTNTFTEALGVSSASASLHGKQVKNISLQVRQTKEQGHKEVRWTPDAVGRYQLRIALLGDDSPTEYPIAGSPFEVRVVPGQSCPTNSRLLVGEDAVRVPGVSHSIMRANASMPIGLVHMLGNEAHVPIRLLLCDRMGNVCPETLDALRLVNVRIESVYLPDCDTPTAHGKRYLESFVAPSTSKGLLTLTIRATPQLIDFLAAASAKGDIKDSCTVLFFVAATDSVSREHLLGSPSRLRVHIPSSCWAAASADQPIALTNSTCQGSIVDCNKPCSGAKADMEDEEEPTNPDIVTIGCNNPKVNISHLSAVANEEVQHKTQGQATSIDEPSHDTDDIAQINQVKACIVSSYDTADMVEAVTSNKEPISTSLSYRSNAITSIANDDSECLSRKDDPCAKESPKSIGSQSSTAASEELSQAEDACTSSSTSKSESIPDFVSLIPSANDLSSSVEQKVMLEYSASIPNPEHMIASLKEPIALPYPSIGFSSPVLTPPIEHETTEKRSLVQLPPISPVLRNSSAIQLHNETHDKAEPLASALFVNSPDKNFTMPASPFDVSSPSHCKAPGRVTSIRDHSMSRMSASSPPMSEKKPSAQTRNQQTNDHKRRTPIVPSGLLVRTGTLKVAPSPWPKARAR